MNQNRYYHKRNLPHYYIPKQTYFITFSLHNSLSPKIIEQLTQQYEEIKNQIQKNIIGKLEQKNLLYQENKKHFYKYDNWLHDYKQSPKYLNNPTVVKIIYDSLIYHNNTKYNLIAFCIMPNHVHLVLRLIESSPSLDKIMFTIKRYTAGQANLILNRKGQFWQHENYDHIIRDEKEFYNIVNYVIQNPVKSGLAENWNEWEGTYLKNLNILDF